MTSLVSKHTLVTNSLCVVAYRLSSNLSKVSYVCIFESLKNSFLPNACFVEDLVLMIIFMAVVNPFLLFFHYM